MLPIRHASLLLFRRRLYERRHDAIFSLAALPLLLPPLDAIFIFADADAPCRRFSLMLLFAELIFTLC